MDTQRRAREQLGREQELELNLFRNGGPTSVPREPPQIRALILTQHQRIRVLLDALERRATRLLAASVPSAQLQEGTRELALRLCSVMDAHIAFENDVMAEALSALDAWGPARAQHLREDHADQLELLRGYADVIARGGSGPELALAAWQLVELIRADMQHEEADILHHELWAQETITLDVETG